MATAIDDATSETDDVNLDIKVYYSQNSLRGCAGQFFVYCFNVSFIDLKQGDSFNFCD